MNRVQINLIETEKSESTINILQRIALDLNINVVDFFEAKNNDTEVQLLIASLTKSNIIRRI